MDLELARTRCRERLVESVEQLQGEVDFVQLDAIAELITQAMTGPWRWFHTTEHIFEVGGLGDAIEVLAALFHDLVYVQVDKGVSVNISFYIAPFVKEVRAQLVIRDANELPDSPAFEMVAAIFGLVPGQSLAAMSGQNEFLSALIAALALSPLLSFEQIAQIIACIEATIPFRPLSSSGLRASEQLYERLVRVSKQFNLGWDESKTVEVVKRSIRLANRDVENFAYPNSANFLDNTWNLLPETNHELVNPNTYTVIGYRESLQKMEDFMNFLTPEWVFQHFRGEPDEAKYLDLVRRTRRNLEVAKLYLGAKLVSIAIVEALSMRLGKNIPVSTMMGELPAKEGIKVPALADFLPAIQSVVKPETELEREVLKLLSEGRNQDSLYDLKNSPIATFIVRSIGFGEMKQMLLFTKEFFRETLSPPEFLDACNAEVIDAIALGVGQLFESRARSFASMESRHNPSAYVVPSN